MALAIGDSILTRRSDEPRRHNELLPVFIDELFVEADVPVSTVDALFWGAGPGSFTGVRLAASVSLGLALGADVGCLAVDSMRATALNAMAAGRASDADRIDAVAVLVDARMSQCYGAFYPCDDDGFPRPAIAELMEPHDLPGRLGTASVRCGDGWALVPAEQPVQGAWVDATPDAEALLLIGGWEIRRGALLTQFPEPEYLIGAGRWKQQPAQVPGSAPVA